MRPMNVEQVTLWYTGKGLMAAGTSWGPEEFKKGNHPLAIMVNIDHCILSKMNYWLFYRLRVSV